MTMIVVTVYRRGPNGHPQFVASRATGTESERYAIDATVQYAFGRAAAFDHYNAYRHPDGLWLAGTVSKNRAGAEIAVRLDITTLEDRSHG